MALSLAVVAIAGVLLAVRANFDPSHRAGAADFRLRGGHHRRARQHVGHARRRHHPRRRAGHRRADRSRLATARRPHRVPGRPGVPARRPVPQGVEWHDDIRVEHANAVQPHRRRHRRRGVRRACGGAVVGRPCRPAAARRNLRLTSRWRACGTCSRVMPASSRSASRPMSASAPTCCSRWRCSPACIRSSRSRSPAVGAAIVSVPVAALIFRLRGALFRDRHLGGGGGVPPAVAAQVSALGGGSGISLPAAVVIAMAPSRARCASS